MLSNLIIYSFIAGLSTVFGVYLVRRFESLVKKRIIFLVSFSIGVLLATAFFHLLPESIELSPSWFYWALGAIIALYLMEHFIILHSCQEEHCEIHSLGATSLLGIGFHSLIDGIIIGLAFKISFAVGVLSSLAVIFHETAEGVFVYSFLLYDETNRKKALFYSWVVALATPFGAILTFSFLDKVSPNILGWLLAAAAGSFIYIGASDLIPATHKEYSFLNIFWVLLGIAFVLGIGQFLG
jgi:zinc and cadmium transporter